jgi:hypothetical protein
LAFPDPRVKQLFSRTRFQLKLHDIAPERFIPNGDRYVVEEIDIDEAIEFGQLLVLVQPKPKKEGDPQADPNVENRGVLAAVIVAVGNGHLLGLPDPGLMRSSDDVERFSADVPMFYKHGDVVLVDWNAKGRNLKIVGRECRIVGQIDVLAAVEGVRLKRTTDGGWEEA